MIRPSVGIDSISFFAPEHYIDLADLAVARQVDVDKYTIGLGQQKMAVLAPDEDIVTMAANAAERVISGYNKNDISMLLFATESAIDQSKSAGLFVHQLLGLSDNCRVIELKQACYSATAAIQLALPYLQLNPDKKVLVIASDVAKYGLNSNAESSQGAGAVAMILSTNPAMIELDSVSGIHAEDVMDFWRPNYMSEAIVKGKYSCTVYLETLEKTWQKYVDQTGRRYDSFSHFLYHIPIPKLAEKAHRSLAKYNHINLTKEAAKQAVENSLLYSRQIGNCYTAALYIGLISLLDNAPKLLSNSRFGFYSYGSGCMGEFFSGQLKAGYQLKSQRQYHEQLLASRKALSIADYERFYSFNYPVDSVDFLLPTVTKTGFRLSAINQHERVYVKQTLVKEQLESMLTEEA